MASSLTIHITPQTPRTSRLHHIPGVYMIKLYLPNKTNQFHFRPLCCVSGGDQNAHDFLSSQNDGANIEGEKNASPKQAALTSTDYMLFGMLHDNRMLEKLRRYGLSGLLSYGLLNTAYYLFTFLIVWFYVVPAPGKLGYLPAVERFFKLLAMVWAGSQVTKLIRAAGALALAPFVEKGLSWFTVKFKFQSEGKAFMAIVGCCFGLALALFLFVTLLGA
ncbi:Transcription factor [Heracleum sosnowskyi]|uniref:Transcription factor n=1 Tax=Heracleum sosnowskyi TaxID=360622 RepID=A0AAD8GPG3_9APIA|nr:Transcription factor [Heracleum sosnowskyi]